MIQAYSQRILPPFSGVVQIAESSRARALSFDGIHWNFQYLADKGHSTGKQRIKGYGLDRGYYDVASLRKKELNTFMFPACLDHGDVSDSISELYEFLLSAQVPFPAADVYEYWLLDGEDRSPLALIYACCDATQMDTFPGQTEWTALPHSKMDVENSESEDARNEPPVNHRFQRLVAGRAGTNPRAAWFNREQYDIGHFPSLLVREDWQEESANDLCQRYLERKAPRLLLLRGLSYEVRERLEDAARAHVFEVEQYFAMYPEVNDERRMNAIRVEAQLRRTAPQIPGAQSKKKESVDKSLDKKLRIFET